MSSALTRRHLLLGAAALPLLASNTVLVGNAAAQSRNINVSNYSQLASAVNDARAGDVIILANGGSFNGDQLTVSARGTAGQPIIIRAQSLLGAKVPNGFWLTGEHITIAGIDFAHSGTSTRIEFAGKHNSVEQCRFRSHGRHIVLLTGSDGRIMYCEFSCPSKDASAPDTISIQTSFNDGTRHMRAEIGYCYFHNMPFKPSNYHERRRVGLGLGLSGLTSQWSTNHYVHHCLFEGTGDCEIEVKTRYNRIEYCTMIGDNAHFNHRLGGNNVFRGCWAENNRGFEIMGDKSKLIGCKTVGQGCEFQIFAGNQSTTSTENGYPQAVDTVLAHCDGQSTVVGRTWNSSMDRPATGTRLEAHSGPIRYGTHSGTVTTGSSNESRVAPVKLGRSAVGPAAKSYTTAAAPSQPQDDPTPPPSDPTPPSSEPTPPDEVATPPAEEPTSPAETPPDTSTGTIDADQLAELFARRSSNGTVTSPWPTNTSPTFEPRPSFQFTQPTLQTPDGSNFSSFSRFFPSSR